MGPKLWCTLTAHIAHPLLSFLFVAWPTIPPCGNIGFSRSLFFSLLPGWPLGRSVLHLLYSIVQWTAELAQDVAVYVSWLESEVVLVKCIGEQLHFRAGESSRISPWAVRLGVGMLTASWGTALVAPPFGPCSLRDGLLGQSSLLGWAGASYLSPDGSSWGIHTFCCNLSANKEKFRTLDLRIANKDFLENLCWMSAYGEKPDSSPCW